MVTKHVSNTFIIVTFIYFYTLFVASVKRNCNYKKMITSKEIRSFSYGNYPVLRKDSEKNVPRLISAMTNRTDLPLSVHQINPAFVQFFLEFTRFSTSTPVFLLPAQRNCLYFRQTGCGFVCQESRRQKTKNMAYKNDQRDILTRTNGYVGTICYAIIFKLPHKRLT